MVKRLTNEHKGGWKDIVNKSLPLRLNDFWLCNVNTNDVRAIFANFKSIPYFWKNVILNWCDFNFKEPETPNEILSQPLWFNSFIKDGQNNLIYYKTWYDSGIFKIADLVISNKLATHFEISTKYENLRIDFLKYYGLLSMIPNKWKTILQNVNNFPVNTICSKLEIISKDSKICSTIVKMSRNEMKDFPTIAYNKWNNNLNLNMSQNDFLSIFEKMYTLSKDKKLLIFKYRLLHRNTITNRNLNLWDQNKPLAEQRTDKCTFCNVFPETIEHLFYDCMIIRQIWHDLFTWIHQVANIRINFSRSEIILGIAPEELNIFNLIFVIVQKYIYTSRCKEKNPNINVIKFLIKIQYEAEKFNASQNARKLYNFNKKWEMLQNCFL